MKILKKSNSKSVAITAFCVFAALQALDLHSSYLLSCGLWMETAHTVDSRVIKESRELLTETNPLLRGATSALEFILKLLLFKLIAFSVWCYSFYKQIQSRSALEVHKDFIYMALTLDALYLFVVIHNYFLISKATL